MEGFTAEDSPAEDSHTDRLIPLGALVLDLGRAELRGPDRQLVPLRRQAMDVLLLLGEHAGHVVGKDELMRRVWPKVIVGDDSLVQTIAEIRRVLGDSDHRWVRTVARRGYLLVPGSSAPAAAARAAAPSASVRPGRPMFGAAIAALLLVVVVTVVAPGGMLDIGRRPLAAAPDAAVEPTTTASATAPSRSLIVLPIRDASAGGEQGWFADALTADLTSALTAYRDVLVVGRGTAARYGGDVDPRDIARELAVRHVIQGSVRRSGNQVRLDVAMVDGQSGVQQWAQQFDIDRGQLAASIDDIKGGLAKTLLIEIGGAIRSPVDRMRPDQFEADDLAMRGFSVYLRNLGPESFAEAARLFDEAVALDPNCVRGLAGVSLVNTMSILMNWQPDREPALQRATAALARLSSVDRDGHLTLLSRAGLTNLHTDWDGLLTIAEQLITRYPNEPTSHHHRCSALLRLGRFDDSVSSCERAIRISPRDSRVAIWQGLIAMNHFMRSDPAKAVEHARRSVSLNTRIPFYQLLLVAALVESGHDEQALKVVEDFKARHPDFAPAIIATLWPGTHPVFSVRRDRIVAIATDLLGR